MKNFHSLVSYISLNNLKACGPFHITKPEVSSAAELIFYSRSQNCWDVFVSSSPLNVGVHDLPTESQ